MDGKKTTATLRPDLEAASAKVTKFLVKTIPASAWRWQMKLLAWRMPIKLFFVERNGFTHPWSIQSRWKGKEGKWAVKVKPGFVNDRAPTVRLSKDQIPFLLAVELTGRDNKELPEHLDVSIEDDPEIRIKDWRSIGWDSAESKEEVPAFFAEQGVRPAGELKGNLLDGLTITHGDLQGANKRSLRAADLVLRQPREALHAEFVMQGNNLVFQLGFTPPPDKIPSLSMQKNWLPPISSEVTASDQLLSGYTDDGFDEIRIATIYAMSPPGHGAYSDPDEKWTLEPRYSRFGFWNMNHDVTAKLEQLMQSRLPYPGLGLAGGVGSQQIIGMVDGLNNQYVEAAALLNRSRFVGKFWSV